MAPEEHAVVMAEPVVNPLANKQKMAQVMFETFNVPALHLVTTAQVHTCKAMM